MDKHASLIANTFLSKGKIVPVLPTNELYKIMIIFGTFEDIQNSDYLTQNSLEKIRERGDPIVCSSVNSNRYKH